MNEIPNPENESPGYGVYSDYESDHKGCFTVTAGLAVTAPNEVYNMIEVKSGEHMIFDISGPMPGAIIDGWHRIWRFFKDSTIERTCKTDFEAYTGPESAQIYIGIESELDK